MWSLQETKPANKNGGNKKGKMQTTTQATAPMRRGPAQGKSGNVERSQIVKTVREDSARNEHDRFEAVKISVEFKLVAREAKSVALAGSFNGWNAKKTPMSKNGDVWQARVELSRGRYEYRFVVDGKWVSDPSAKESAANPFGGDNSVLIL
jgi:1,4-alpha-glucan branching enzyme